MMKDAKPDLDRLEKKYKDKTDQDSIMKKNQEITQEDTIGRTFK